MAKEQVLYKSGLALYDAQSVIRMNTAIGTAKDEAIAAAANAFRYATVKDNSIEFYSENPITGESTPAVTVDLPTEMYLDQTKTTFVNDFVFSDETYPGATNPNMDGEPVIVLAVKGSDNSVTYSFMNMKTLIDVYAGVETNTVAVSVGIDNKISANVKVSTAEGNLITVNEDGLFVAAVDQTSKADKLVGEAISADQILVDDGNGNLKGSGKTVADIEQAIADAQAAAEGKAGEALAAAEAAQGEVDALEELVGELPEGATATTVVGYAKEVADAVQGEVDALEELVGEIPADAEATTVVAYAKEVADAAQAEADARIEVLEQKVGEGYEAITDDYIMSLFNNAE